MTLPYKLAIDPSKGFYYFTTDNDLTYYCNFWRRTTDFSPILGIYDVDIYEFEFDFYNPNVDNKDNTKEDKRVSATIIHLIRLFFTDELKVMVFACDNSDGMHRGRDLLFTKWHRELKDALIRIPVTINIEIEEGIINTVYGCTLVRTDFPHMDILHTELIDEAAGIIGQKYSRQ